MEEGISGIRRCLSQVSILLARATSTGEAAWREELFKYRQARYASKRIRRRIVFKHGDCNIVQGNVAKRRKRYLQDLFTTLVDAQWRWTLLVFAMSFLLSWFGFGLLWWVIAYAHGDTEPDGGNLTSCVTGVDSFASGFLFSVETQHTIGYGVRAPTVECPEAVFIMCLQSIVGVFIQAFMVGIVFAKLSRPKKRAQTLLFSDRCAVNLRDGRLSLMFRVADLRKSHIVEAHARAQLIKSKVTKEGELLPFYQQELKVGADGEEDRLMFIWPTTIVHIINESSPLYNLSASDMLRERFEIVVMLEGVIESTGMTTQARSSYLPSEIFWGHRFEPIVTFKKESGEYEVDYTLFNNTYEVDTPLCSAKQLDELRATINANNRANANNVMPIAVGAAQSNDTLDSCSVDSMSLDDHIEIKIPDAARIQENRRLLDSQSDLSAQNHNKEETGNGLFDNHNHHGIHHQLSQSHGILTHAPYDGLNGSTHHIFGHDHRLPRTYSGQFTKKNTLEIPDVPTLKIPVKSESTPPPDLV